ncbi:MAG TPA: hypothetical protein VGI81_29055 [Tepidisphaeraceae bacterium]
MMLVKDDRPRVVGTLFTNDEAQAQSMAPALCRCAAGEQVRIRRTEDREIPLRWREATIHIN